MTSPLLPLVQSLSRLESDAAKVTLLEKWMRENHMIALHSPKDAGPALAYLSASTQHIADDNDKLRAELAEVRGRLEEAEKRYKAAEIEVAERSRCVGGLQLRLERAEHRLAGDEFNNLRGTISQLEAKLASMVSRDVALRAISNAHFQGSMSVKIVGGSVGEPSRIAHDCDSESFLKAAESGRAGENEITQRTDEAVTGGANESVGLTSTTSVVLHTSIAPSGGTSTAMAPSPAQPEKAVDRSMLARCPWCGSEPGPVTAEDNYLHCSNVDCKAIGPDGGITAWNARAGKR